MDGILDFDHELNINLFDHVVLVLFGGHGPEQAEAQRVLSMFQEHPLAWQRVPQLLAASNNQNSKYICCQILEKLIQTRWRALSDSNRNDIKSFITSAIISNSDTEEKLRKERMYLHKMNLLLVQILKQDWPTDWPDFIPMIVHASKSNLNMCENNMEILKLMSEEIFDFSAEQLTSTKTKALKAQMCGEFGEIFGLCSEVLGRSTKGSLLRSTLETLLRFLNWIPLGYIFETELITFLVSRFLEVAEFRNVTLKCLAEISSLTVTPEYNRYFLELFVGTMSTMNRMIPPTTNIAHAYATSTDSGQELVMNFCQFLCNFLTYHLRILETEENQQVLGNAHEYLIRLSLVDDREMFKLCLEYWSRLISELYDEMAALPMGGAQAAVMGLNLGNAVAENEMIRGFGIRKTMYESTLSQLRLVMIEKMVKPEEVLIVENDEGEIVKEIMKETDTIVLYKSMREVLIYLTHLDTVDTENLLTEKLAKQVDGSEWSWNNLNTLCWAIGSISGSMDEETEKRFLVTVIKDLLGLCELKRGKDNKAVVASNIMYIVGQYPRFLKAHWKFLKTVVNKLFEFMHELHEGVQEMACDTFIKIAQKCRRHFVLQQAGETEPFIDEILRTLYRVTSDLREPQMHTFYEALGYMIASQPNKPIQEKLISTMMDSPNQTWANEMNLARTGVNIVADTDNAKIVSNVLKINVAVCTSLGTFYLPQLGKIWNDLLAVYSTAGRTISEAVATSGDMAIGLSHVRQCRTIKKEILKLIQTFIAKAEDVERVNTDLVPPLLNTILADYRDSLPAARDSEVINIINTVVGRMGPMVAEGIPSVIECIFEPTIVMISPNESDFPEQRIAIFKLLRTINTHCFEGLLKLTGPRLFNTLNSISFAFKHLVRDVAETGLNICYEAINNFVLADPSTANGFFQAYYLKTMTDVLYVMTDSDHKSGFKLQIALLQRLIQLVVSNAIQVPLYDPTAVQVPSNEVFVKGYMANLLKNAFGHMSNSQIDTFVEQLFSFSSDVNRFKLAARDFLISLKQFAGEDNAELYIEEREAETQRVAAQQLELAMRVPGMVKQDAMDEEL